MIRTKSETGLELLIRLYGQCSNVTPNFNPLPCTLRQSLLVDDLGLFSLLHEQLFARLKADGSSKTVASFRENSLALLELLIQYARRNGATCCLGAGVVEIAGTAAVGKSQILLTIACRVLLLSSSVFWNSFENRHSVNGPTGSPTPTGPIPNPAAPSPTSTTDLPIALRIHFFDCDLRFSLLRLVEMLEHQLVDLSHLLLAARNEDSSAQPTTPCQLFDADTSDAIVCDCLSRVLVYNVRSLEQLHLTLLRLSDQIMRASLSRAPVRSSISSSSSDSESDGDADSSPHSSPAKQICAPKPSPASNPESTLNVNVNANVNLSTVAAFPAPSVGAGETRTLTQSQPHGEAPAARTVEMLLFDGLSAYSFLSRDSLFEPSALEKSVAKLVARLVLIGSGLSSPVRVLALATRRLLPPGPRARRLLLQVRSDCVEHEDDARRALSSDYVCGALDSLVTLRLHVERVEPASTATGCPSEGADAPDADCESAAVDEGDPCATEQPLHQPQQQQSPPVACTSALAEADAEADADADAAQTVRHSKPDQNVLVSKSRTRFLVRAFPMTGSARTGRESRSLLFDARLSDSGFLISQPQSSPEF